MANRTIKLRGGGIPAGTLIGRVGNNNIVGAASLVKISDLATKSYVLQVAGLPAIADGDIVANISGGTAVPIGNTLTQVMDYTLAANSPAQGQILYRNATGWVILAPGTSGYILSTGGAGANPSWVPNATAANPTATAGPVAVNGVATTFMRSDAAPAIQLASNAQKGVVQGDGSSITITAGVASATGFVPLAAAFHPGYRSGLYYGAPTTGSSSTTTTTAANTLYAVPIYIGVSQTFTKFAFNVTGGNAGNFEGGIYTNSGGLPVTLIQDFGSHAVVLGKNEITGLTITLSPGWYWLVVAFSSASVVCTSFPAMTNTPGGMLFGSTVVNGNATGGADIEGSWTYSAGNLPTPFPTVVAATKSSFLGLFVGF